MGCCPCFVRGMAALGQRWGKFEPRLGRSFEKVGGGSSQRVQIEIAEGRAAKKRHGARPKSISFSYLFFKKNFNVKSRWPGKHSFPGHLCVNLRKTPVRRDSSSPVAWNGARFARLGTSFAT